MIRLDYTDTFWNQIVVLSQLNRLRKGFQKWKTQQYTGWFRNTNIEENFYLYCCGFFRGYADAAQTLLNSSRFTVLDVTMWSRDLNVIILYRVKFIMENTFSNALFNT